MCIHPTNIIVVSWQSPKHWSVLCPFIKCNASICSVFCMLRFHSLWNTKAATSNLIIFELFISKNTLGTAHGDKFNCIVPGLVGIKISSSVFALGNPHRCKNDVTLKPGYSPTCALCRTTNLVSGEVTRRHSPYYLTNPFRLHDYYWRANASTVLNQRI